MASEEQRAEEAVREAFLRLTEGYIGRATRDDLMMAAALSAKTMSRGVAAPPRDRKRRRSLMAFALLLCGWIYGGGSFERGGAAGPLRSLQGTRCLLPNNYLVWEFTRPVSSCDYCRDVGAPLVLPENLTREEFAAYSYSSRPMIVKNATHDWPARDHFTLQFFRELYERTEGAYESVEEECQFLHFKSDFANLREVFAMSERRASHSDGESAWYVGWKNCHPRILDAMGRFYSAPRFLPEDAEIPYSNYVFLGYEEGAVMHLDYISRLMWQAQLIGSKTWTVAPTPECDSECKPFEFFVDTADVVLLDTRIWYHGTYVENGGFSLTVTSEYG